MLTALFAFLAELFGKWINKAPAVAPVAQELGKTQEALSDAQAGNTVLSEAVRARTDADTRLMQSDNGAAGSVNAAPDAAINKDPDGHYRD